MGKHKRVTFGCLPDGRMAELCTLSSEDVQVTISTLGAAIVGVRTPDKSGVWADIALGFDTPAEYLEKPGCLGATIGRYAGRIANGTFQLNGKPVALMKNRGVHTIHGGPDGFSRRLWSVRILEDDRLELELFSPDGDQGFPGAVTVWADFALKENVLTLKTVAVSDTDTVCSLTNHVYWNLMGHDSGTVDGQLLSVPAKEYLETDRDTIPTGRKHSLMGTPLDLHTPTLLETIEADHSFLLPSSGGKIQSAGRIQDSVSGRWLELSTDLPSVQVYTSDHLPEGMQGKNGAVYGPRSGVCLEPQFYPDSPNHADFPSTVIHKGETVTHWICWRFGTKTDMEEPHCE